MSYQVLEDAVKRIRHLKDRQGGGRGGGRGGGGGGAAMSSPEQGTGGNGHGSLHLELKDDTLQPLAGCTRAHEPGTAPASVMLARAAITCHREVRRRVIKTSMKKMRKWLLTLAQLLQALMSSRSLFVLELENRAAWTIRALGQGAAGKTSKLKFSMKKMRMGH